MSDALVSFDGDRLQQHILELRGERVMIDSDLGALYGVTTKRFNEQIKRNSERFPVDFMFQLTETEKGEVVANCDHLAKLKYSPHPPRAFVRLRQFMAEHQELAARLEELEARVAKHDNTLSTLVATIRQMASPPANPSRQIGFIVDRQEKKQ